jgi:hypothetical protein
MTKTMKGIGSIAGMRDLSQQVPVAGIGIETGIEIETETETGIETETETETKAGTETGMAIAMSETIAANVHGSETATATEIGIVTPTPPTKMNPLDGDRLPHLYLLRHHHPHIQPSTTWQRAIFPVSPQLDRLLG